MRQGRGTRGFTLVETILASVILCAAVLALGAISSRSLMAMQLAEHKKVATALADRQMTLIDYIGIDEFVELGQMDGKVEHVEPEYRWQVTTESMEIDDLCKVNVTVSWAEWNRLYSVSVDTVLNTTEKRLEIEGQ